MLDYKVSKETEPHLRPTLVSSDHAPSTVCGLHTLEDSLEAFAARYQLAARAQRTLDVQYYIWEDDVSGRLLFQALLDAANRGVEVRLLLDDNNTSGLDDTLRVLDAHPNIEVRLFNPFSFRTLRMLGYLTDFARLNRRMHNKSFSADGEATIIGGRNVGDAYFGIGEEPLFTDLDVLAIGPVVKDVEEDFERYWQSACVAKLEHVLSEEGSPTSTVSVLNFDEQQQAAAERYLKKMAATEVSQRLAQCNLPFIRAQTKLLSDDPRKGQGKASRRTMLPERLRSVMGTPETNIDIISSYFVPGRAGVALILQLVRKGVKVAILTNSLAANDVAVVHAGYARWRKKLLRHGVELYELKPTHHPRQGLRDRGLTGNSGSSLHAKTFSVDGKKVFIGSFNFDQRSALLNTEMGLVIDSESLAQRIHHRFVRSQRDAAWQLRLTRWGKIHWIDREDGKETVLKREPMAKFWQRVLVLVAYVLPVEWLL
ncbi:phospholipase D family protein [Scandinavium sp. V105_16]|uniref:Phospholipase D family protein n=1 Tax=Scandinavium lactucae TaxID=3095028 RepID=A0AAJ2VVU9_9ENTR|nr:MULTISPECIES: phospholipase D family protein [unclassified Scandinavium]MDX6022681.1 phospholipase D family protein [Scandinavium sp. V105_16]MDX6033477.1 phospholipase D family protein [Scandinavium sp. V105_12]